MKSQTLKNIIKRKLNSLEYYSKVAVEFPAEKKILYMTEVEIRAIQVEAALRFKLGGQEAFDAFTSQFIIYNGPTKRGSKPMILRTDGRFSNEFKRGFFNVSSTLALELF